MSDIDAPHGRGLTGKLGPLPVWAWGGILGVVVLGVYLFRQRASGSTTAPDSTDGSALDAIGYATGGLGKPAADTDNASSNASGSPTDSTSWISGAATAVAAQSTASAAAVLATLQRYVYQGGSFTAQEQKWIDTAINLKGAPPQGTNGDVTFQKPTTSTPVTTTPAPKPATPSTGSSAQNPYTFFKKGGTMFITNVNTGKSAGIKSGADYAVLRAYVASINSHKPFDSGKTSISSYIQKVS